MSRRLICVIVGLAACAPVTPAMRSEGTTVPAASQVRLVAAVDLAFLDPRASELSSLAWDEASRTLFAMSDSAPMIVPFSPSADLRAWSIGVPLRLAVPSPWDGEGMVALPGAFVIANETGPHLLALGRDGAFVAELPIPSRYKERCRRNKCFESLGATSDGKFLYTANECALEGDGPMPTASEGTLVRILKIDRLGERSTEHAYRTDPIFAPGGGDMGVVDVTALAEDDLLVLERSHVPGIGTSVKLFRVKLAGATDVSSVERLAADTPVLTKQLVLDFGALAFARPTREGSTELGPLPNYEGVALGPRTTTGEQILFFVSDNNGSPQQAARLLVLALRGL